MTKALQSLPAFSASVIFSLLTWTAIAFADEANSPTVNPPPKNLVPPISLTLRIDWWLPTNSQVDMFYGGFGNEIYSLRFGFPIKAWLGDIEPFIQPGFLFEDSNLIGVNSGRQSNEESKLRLIPLRFGLAYNFDPYHFIVVPSLESGYTLTFFDLEEDNVSVDGNKHLLSFRASLRLMLDRLVNEADWRDFMDLRSAYFALGCGYDINLIGDGLKLDGWILGPEVGIVF